jgi:DNA-binding transcriptional LysR family regulator
MEIRDLQNFVALFDAGHFRRAAKSIGVDVSTLSRRISHLEDELGVLLFERTRSGVRLTAAGQDALRFARNVLSELQALRDSALQAGRGRRGALKLAIQVPAFAGHARALLHAYRLAFPDISLQLTRSTEQDVYSGLRERRYHAAILFSPSVSPEIQAWELWVERLVLAVPAGHQLAQQSSIRWDELQAEKVIVRGLSGSESFRDLEASLLGREAFFSTHNADCLDLLTLVSLQEGVMIALDSHRHLSVPDVSFLDLDEPDANIGVSLAWAPDLEDPVAGTFIAFARDRSGVGLASRSGANERRSS